MPASLQDRVVVMSGGSRGIGLAIGVELARAGARIALMAKTDRPHPKLPGTVHTAAEEIEAAAAMSGTGRSYPPDPARADAYDRLYEVYRDIYPSLRPLFARLSAAVGT